MCRWYIHDIRPKHNEYRTHTERIEQTTTIQKIHYRKRTTRIHQFLYLTIHRKNRNVLFSIYRKPTQTDITIPNSSCHQYEHKLSGIIYLLNQLHAYLITKVQKTQKWTLLKAYYEYNTNLIRKPHPPRKQNTHTDPQHQKTKWVTFTYSGNEVRRITKLFQDTWIKIAFSIRNTIQTILQPMNKQIRITEVAFTKWNV
jgi:hypothetical protein